MSVQSPQPFTLKDAPALIEAVFPAQKVSFEAQRERKAGAGQTLTALGSYWKGRKPLILVRAILLGSLLPQTDDPEKDLEIFERLMAFDNAGLARREPKLKPADIAERVALVHPWHVFSYTIKGTSHSVEEIDRLQLPIQLADYPGLTLRWRRDLQPDAKREMLAQALATFSTYEERAALCKRPEELDQAALYAPIWPAVNAHLGRFGIQAQSHQELVEQLGVLRFGHRPKVGDTFCGGGSIPFEAARLGCDVYASDLNPIACMLTWGALNIIGASPEQRAEIERTHRDVAKKVDQIITRLRIEHDSQGNRAKAYLYCLETRCPETGWMVPMAPSWVISKTHHVVAKLVPDHDEKRFKIEIKNTESEAEMQAAEQGTVRNGNLVYELDGRTYLTPVKTLRGDYRDADGNTTNRLRRWDKHDFKPRPKDVFQERLYCIQWMRHDTLDLHRPEIFFKEVTGEDLERERRVDSIVAKHLADWQERGLVPDMAIEPGDKTDEPIRTRGWMYWHQLFDPRTMLSAALLNQAAKSPADKFNVSTLLDNSGRLVRWHSTPPHKNGGGRDLPANVFSNQALNTLFNFAVRSWWSAMNVLRYDYPGGTGFLSNSQVRTHAADMDINEVDIFVTDPPYADAVHYHEITEYFIAWLRKNPPPPFDQWTWDSRRELAIKGSGDDFRRGMVDAYKTMTEQMPDNGMQCVMFTHQDTGVWSDMVSIFWAAGLQVVGAWYIATETTSELKKGGYVQGTVILMLRKRPAGDRPGFKQRILPAVKREVDEQIKQMLHLNTETATKLGAPVFNDSDLQMAGYAAALKVLTGFTSIGGEDVTSFALRPRRKGETTVVDEIVGQAAETANSLLVPDGLDAETWGAINGIQRFYLRMLDMETTGASKLDNYQNFAKAFRVADYAAIMASIKPNAARLKTVTEFKPRDLTERTEIGPTPLGALIIAIQEFLADKEPEAVMANLRDAVTDYLGLRPKLIDMASFIATKARQAETRRAAEAIAGRMRNQRLQ
ncbi:MAG: DNA methylase [Halochromatium sp.]|nr:DNA methylase [Halochromatium sp.]